MTFDSIIEIPFDKVSVFQDNLLTIAPNLSHIEIKEVSEGKYRIFLKKTSGCNISEIVNQLDKLVYSLFNGILQIENNENGNANKNIKPKEKIKRIGESWGGGASGGVVGWGGGRKWWGDRVDEGGRGGGGGGGGGKRS